MVLVKNVDPRDGLVNGARGVVTRLTRDTKRPVVRFTDGVERTVMNEVSAPPLPLTQNHGVRDVGMYVRRSLTMSTPPVRAVRSGVQRQRGGAGGGATHAVASGPGVGAVGASQPTPPAVSFPPRYDPLSLLP